MVDFWKWYYEKDLYIRSFKMLIKIGVLIWLVVMVSAPVSNYLYFYKTYNTFPQEVIYTDFRGNVKNFSNTFFIGVPLGVEEGTFSYRYVTEPTLRRDNDAALKSYGLIEKYSTIVLLIYILMFLQDLFMFYYAKAKTLGIPYKQTLKEGIIKGLYIDAYLTLIIMIKEKLTAPRIPK